MYELTLEDLEGMGVCRIQAHMVLSCGDHGSGYTNCRRITHNAVNMDRIGLAIERKITDAYKSGRIKRPHGLVSPAKLAQELTLLTALHAEWKYPSRVRRLWCNVGKDAATWPDGMGFADWVPGENFVIIDDTLTTGQTVRKVKELIEAHHGTVTAVVTILGRSCGLTAEQLGVDAVMSLVELEFDTYPPDQCPLCRDKVPMRLHPGHGWEWIGQHPNYPIYK
jgi:orotate phosphoribosyltransferase